jgi:Zn-dependent protease with chaperone function
MFNNVLYFIIVLLIFNVSSQESRPEASLGYTFSMILFGFLALAAYSRWGFHRLLESRRRRGGGDGRFAGEYHGLVLKLSIFSILIFALDIHLFNLRYWLQAIPGFRSFSVLQGAVALALFLGYLAVVWHFAWPAYREIFGVDFTRSGFVASNLKFNIPILFPWIILTLVVDLASLVPSNSMSHLLNSPEGQILFFAVFLSLLMIFMPPLIQTWWGCEPFPDSGRIRELEAFLREKSFRYRRLLQWPLLEGRILTAGIMGLIPRFRYILVTNGLMEALSVQELKAVLAHEMGHARYRHMLFYLLFLLGYMVISFGIFDISFSVLAVQPFFMRTLGAGESQASNLFYLALSLPILATMILYFRYVMGFFMRHFERQADLYSAVTMGTPKDTISSLERIAFLGGKIRDLPSWHHFSIRQRVDYLIRMVYDPILIRKHARFLRLSLGCYLVCMAGLGYLLYYSPARQDLTMNLVGKVLKQQLAERPNDVDLYQNLAMVYHRMERWDAAMEAYEKIIQLSPGNGPALNNLAWLLVTAPEESLRDKGRGLELAKKAVVVNRTPVFLDTLAEAYYANGYTQEAVETIQEAVAMAPENPGYYRSQLKKFTAGEGRERSGAK